jgi:hypothetical protein
MRSSEVHIELTMFLITKEVTKILLQQINIPLTNSKLIQQQSTLSDSE